MQPNIFTQQIHSSPLSVSWPFDLLRRYNTFLWFSAFVRRLSLTDALRSNDKCLDRTIWGIFRSKWTGSFDEKFGLFVHSPNWSHQARSNDRFQNFIKNRTSRLSGFEILFKIPHSSLFLNYCRCKNLNKIGWTKETTMNVEFWIKFRNRSIDWWSVWWS